MKILLALLLTALILTGCGLMEVTIDPSPAAGSTGTGGAAGQPSAALVASSAPDDNLMVVRTIGYPHLVYAPNGPAIELFEQQPPATEYMIINTGLGYRLRLEWHALWEQDIYGLGSIEMDVYLRAPGAADYEYAQYAAAQPLENYGAAFRTELLDATLYLPGSGRYGLKANVRISMQDGSGNTLDRSFTYEGEVLAMDTPADEINQQPIDFQPLFGELEANGYLMDWRGWAYGPCFIQTEDNPTATRLLDEACTSMENGDWSTADQALSQALDAVGENPVLQGRLRMQLGTLAAAQGQWNAAVRHFREAITLWESLNNALEMGIALHNLGSALTTVGLWEEGIPMLEMAGRLRDQMSDWRGSLLTWSQLGVYWQSLEMLDGLVPQLTDNEMAQAEWVQRYTEMLRTQAEEEAAGESDSGGG